MTLEIIRAILAWSAVVNLGILVIWYLFFALAHDWVYRFHSRWFKLSVEKFDAIHYSGMIIYKAGIFLFNLAPYFALRILL